MKPRKPVVKEQIGRKKLETKGLDVPKLTTARGAAGISKPKRQKKGKVFVEDREKMLAILSSVNDVLDNRMQSKREREVQLEGIRAAKKEELEKKTRSKDDTLNAKKQELKRKNKPRMAVTEHSTKKKKKVAFGP